MNKNGVFIDKNKVNHKILKRAVLFLEKKHPELEQTISIPVKRCNTKINKFTL